MHRLGFDYEDMERLGRELAACSELRVCTVFSHLATADEETKADYVHHQYEQFVQSCDALERTLGYCPRRHLLNTAGIERYPQYALDMARLGIGLYGFSPTARAGVEPIARFSTVILQVKDLKAGEYIGYGCRGAPRDAAARGLRTGIVEMGDWASGTSSWSSKLVHGGLRYLYQLNFALVHEALTERGRLLSTTAPHLVKAQPFLWPLKHHYERSYSAVGVGMYDALALAGSRGRKTVPIQRHLGRKGTSALAPSLDTSGLAGSIRFFDARVDDARLVIDLVRTAVGLGALAANRTKATGFITDERGHVHGARVTDLATGATHEVRAKRTINAAGVWTEDVQDLATDAGGLKVLASKGIHIVVPKEAIDAETGVFLRTEKSVLFIIPWPEYWVIGTTDTPWDLDVSKPVATAADVDYILEHANSVLSRAITRDDIIGVYAGLRPLLQPKLKPGAEAASTKVSREHTVTRIAPGLTAIAGGKLTTYRVMASDAVDHALGEALAHAHPCATQELPLVGAAGYHALAKRAGRIAGERGWTLERVTHLLDRYGDETPALLESIDTASPEARLGEPKPRFSS